MNAKYSESSSKAENNKNTGKAPSVDFRSFRICPVVETLGEESPDEEFVFYTEEGEESFCELKGTYGFAFEFVFNADEGGVRGSFAGPVELEIRSDERRFDHHYRSINAPCKLVKHHGNRNSYADGSWFFLKEDNEETEELFEYGYANAEGRLEIKDYVVANEECAVFFDISVDFRTKDGVAEVGKEGIRVVKTAAKPVSEIIGKDGE